MAAMKAPTTKNWTPITFKKKVSTEVVDVIPPIEKEVSIEPKKELSIMEQLLVRVVEWQEKMMEHIKTQWDILAWMKKSEYDPQLIDELEKTNPLRYENKYQIVPKFWTDVDWNEIFDYQNAGSKTYKTESIANEEWRKLYPKGFKVMVKTFLVS